jgi:hypothetical protein
MANIHKPLRMVAVTLLPHAGIVLSDLGLAAVVYGLYHAGLTLGWAWLVKSYVVPYLIVNFWLVTITFLQHTHPNLPHYEDEEWDWLRGALATVDRRYACLCAWRECACVCVCTTCLSSFHALPWDGATVAMGLLQGMGLAAAQRFLRCACFSCACTGPVSFTCFFAKACFRYRGASVLLPIN